MKNVIYILSALFLILFVTACDLSDKGNGDVLVDTAALEAKISEAESAKTGVRTDTAADNVPLGVSWVTTGEMSALDTAIEFAKNIRDTSNNQTTIDNAVTSLTTAINAFNAAKKSGTNEPVNTSALLAKIAQANIAKIGVVETNDGSTVAMFFDWVLPAVMTTFNTAITTAQGVSDTATKQADVDAAVTALEAAITAFNTAKAKGTKSDGFSQEDLDELIANSNAIKIDVIEGTDANDVAPGAKWVEVSFFSDLESKITQAQGVIEPGHELDLIYNALGAAYMAFAGALKTGNVPNKTALSAAIDAADTAKTGVLPAENAASATSGSKWATAAQFSPFNAAYSSATTVNGDPNATVNQVNAATTNLVSATSTFSSQVTANGPGTYVPVVTNATVTITGLDSYNGKGAAVILFDSFDTLILFSLPVNTGLGEDYIINGTLTVDLVKLGGHYTPWNEGGLWYMYILIEGEYNGMRFTPYMINTSAHNFTTNPTPIIAFSNFYLMEVFSITIDQYVLIMSEGQVTFEDHFGPSTDWETFIISVSPYGNYQDWFDDMENSGGVIRQDPELNNHFLANTPINANTRMYSNFAFWDTGSNDNSGRVIGALSGSIPLQDIPAGATVYITASGRCPNTGEQKWGSRTSTINTGGSSSGNFYFNIPIREYDFNEYESPYQYWDIEFRLYVEVSNNRGFDIYLDEKMLNEPFIEGPPNSSIDKSLPSNFFAPVSLAYVTLSGNINVSYNGAAAPRIRLFVDPAEGGSGYLGITEFSNSAANFSYEIFIRREEAVRGVNLWIAGFNDSNQGDHSTLFNFRVPVGNIPLNSNSIFNIDVGNLTTNTVRVLNAPAGSYNLYVIDNYNYLNGSYTSDFTGTGTGSGGSITLNSWPYYAEPWAWYRVIIDTGSEVRVTRITNPVFHGVSVVDWNGMGTLTIDSSHKKALRVTALESWAGLDIIQDGYSFQENDEIYIKGVNMTDGNQILLNTNHGAWRALGGWQSIYYVGNTFENTFFLSSADIDAINANSGDQPKSIRIRGNATENGVFIINELRVRRGGTIILDLSARLSTLSVGITDPYDIDSRLQQAGTVSFEVIGP